VCSGFVVGRAGTLFRVLLLVFLVALYETLVTAWSSRKQNKKRVGRQGTCICYIERYQASGIELVLISCRHGTLRLQGPPVQRSQRADKAFVALGLGFWCCRVWCR
jgi:hypothetical protein